MEKRVSCDFKLQKLLLTNKTKENVITRRIYADMHFIYYFS